MRSLEGISKELDPVLGRKTAMATVVTRLGLCYDPPSIVVEYRDRAGAVMNRTIRMRSLRPTAKPVFVARALARKNADYFGGGKVGEGQIVGLVGRLLNGMRMRDGEVNKQGGQATVMPGGDKYSSTVAKPAPIVPAPAPAAPPCVAEDAAGEAQNCVATRGCCKRRGTRCFVRDDLVWGECHESCPDGWTCPASCRK